MRFEKNKITLTEKKIRIPLFFIYLCDTHAQSRELSEVKKKINKWE